MPSNVVAVAIRDDEADKDFRADVKNLMARLEELVKEVDIEDKEKLLSSYLMEREKNGSSQFRVDPPHVPKFYEVDPQNIKIEKVIGSGGFGTVLKVNWLGLMCAQKLLEVPKEAFLKEVCALVALNHPCIVKLLCCSCEEPQGPEEPEEPKASLVMELMPMSLYDYIKQKKNMPFGIVAAIDMMLQIALGVEYLHGQGVVHRDLKSMNILVTPSAHEELRSEGFADVKLTDFGLAKMRVFDRMQPTYKMLGSSKWIAPEAMDVLPSQRIDWRKADAYSFGITCSEILADQELYCGVPAPKVCEKVKGGLSPTLPSDCPVYLSEFLKRCWHGVPEARPYFEEIVDSLTRFKTYLLKGMDVEFAPVKAPRLLGYLRNASIGLFKRVLVGPRLTALPDPLEMERFEARDANIQNMLEVVASKCRHMNEHQIQEVQICRSQCEYLVQEYLEGVQKIKSMYNHVYLAEKFNLFRSNKLQQFAASLDKLIASVLAVGDLLQACGGNRWKLTALTLAIPQSKTKSRFGIQLWELYWNLFVIHHVMLNTIARRSKTSPQLLAISSNVEIQWCNERCRLVLRRNTDNEVVDHECLGADATRQVEDRRTLLASLEKFSNYISGFCPSCNDQLAARLKNLESPSTTFDWESHENCYWFDPVQLQHMSEMRHRFENWTVYEWRCLDEMVTLEVHIGAKEWCYQVIAVLARIQHPNVVHFIGYQLNEFEKECFLCNFTGRMPEDLWSLIRRNTLLYSGGPFSLPVTIDILLQIVEAMLHVHKCGVMHGSLNPRNICVSPKYALNSLNMNIYYTVKLKGFSSAKMVTSISERSYAQQSRDGTIGYMGEYTAPEVWTEEVHTKCIDAWSFGSIAYYLISG